MMKKIILIVFILVMVSILVFRCRFKDNYEMSFSERFAFDTLEQRAQEDPEYFPVIMHDLPQGFVALDSALEGLEEILDVIFFEHSFSVRDSDDITIFATLVGDSSFIIIHNNAYYVDEKKISEVIQEAVLVNEQRQTIYGIGDVVEIRGRGEDKRILYSIVITDAEMTVTGGAAVYEIKFTINPEIDDNTAIGFFDHVTSRTGRKHSNFVLIDKETVKIEIGRFERINTLTLITPDELNLSVSQDVTRRVRLK